MKSLLRMSNATKAQLIIAINSFLALIVAFDVVLTQAQIGAVSVFANAVLSLFVAKTYGQSSMRNP